ncbi:MAG: hypothetical protein U9N61_08095 [Euryarchaeota archaeon]|nr:hypothetical protein [Euryarchaeota archaeon]
MSTPKPDKLRADVTIVVPHPSRSIAYKDVGNSIRGLMSYTKQAGYVIALSDDYGACVAINRNRGVHAAKSLDSKWILFYDDDMVAPASGLLRLMEHDVDVVSGVCVRRKEPFEVCSYIMKGGDRKSVVTLPDGMPKDTLMEVDSFGAAFVLVKMSVFDKIEKPYFAFPPNGDTGGVLGEDLYFSQKLKEAGIKLHLDTGLVIGHIGDYTYTIDDYYAYQEMKKSDG